MPEFAGIIVNISHESVDHTFSYRIPKNLKNEITIGTKVTVPFGAANVMRKGYVVSLHDEIPYDESKVKEIDSVIMKEENNEDRMIRLAAWIRSYYGSTMIQALKIVLPMKKTFRPVEKRTIALIVNEQLAEQLYQKSLKKKQTAKARLLEALLEEKVLEYQLVKKKLHIADSTIKSLEKQAIIQIITENYFRNPVIMEKTQKVCHVLNQKQQEIVNDFESEFKNGIRKTYLLHGITGSGKTEVYIAMIQKVIALKRQAIFLIPEIALTYQTVLRFYRYFGERVSILNSTLSEGEKYDQFQRAKKGEIDIIIGPRSALFTPFPNIGLIIIDEEHEPSYKSESMPKYHAREVALQLAKMIKCSLVLGSATPSVESYYHAMQGEYKLYKLDQRASGISLPNVSIADMRLELRNGNRSIFSKQLKNLMEERIEKKEQIMLFLNRRGYAGFISCRSCGEVLKCPHCDISLSEHRDGSLRCHYCGYVEKKPLSCPNCNSKYIMGFRAGTQQVEQEVMKLFPNVKVLRMDKDTTTRKDSYEKIFSAFQNGEADILIGTQMIVKGHDFPNVTLMGIMAADLSLAANDYRAGERTFDLLTQAAGRAGRSGKMGEVVIQTYQPEHYANVYAAKQDYEGFYHEEILYRELSGYPPICHMLAVMIQSKEAYEAKKLAEQLSALVNESNVVKEKKISLIGPVPAGIQKINDYYRYVFYLKSMDDKLLTEMKDKMEYGMINLNRSACSILFDYDPVNPF